jgi:hypothetical protein
MGIKIEKLFTLELEFSFKNIDSVLKQKNGILLSNLKEVN